MKAQNCILCGGKAKAWEDRQGDEEEILAFCLDEFNKDCDFKLGDFSIDLETWNRLRIAPDDKDVMTFPVREKDCLYINDTTKAVWEANWMNPHYPKDSDGTADKTD